MELDLEDDEPSGDDPGDEGDSLRSSIEAAFDDDGDPGDGNDAPPAEPVAIPDDKAREVPPEVTEEPIPPPPSYSKESREFWSSIPRQLQQEIYKRETDRDRAYYGKMEEIARRHREYQALDDLFAPYRDEMLAKGLSHQQLVGQYLAFEKAYAADPVRVINNLLAAQGLKVEDLTRVNQAEDPRYQSLLQEVNQLRGMMTNREQEQEHQYEELARQEAYNFANEMGEDGKPLRPYFEQVAPVMLPLMEQFREANPGASNRQILEAAYDWAVHAHPKTRSALLNHMRETQAAELQQKARSKAAKAIRASSPPRGNPGGTVNGATDLSLRETIEQAWSDTN